MASAMEPHLDPNPDRFAIYPIRHDEIFGMYKRAVACFWTPEEVDLARDLNDWSKLTPPEQHFIQTVLAFFATSDGIVNENLVQNFASEIQTPEARCFYGFQIAMENIHNEMYSIMINTFVRDPNTRDSLFRATENIPAIQRKAQWTLAWCDSRRRTFAERLIAFAIVEGVFFSGAFCAIFWLKQRGLMPGLGFSNELISRDEALHCEFACLIHKQLLSPTSPRRIREILSEAVEIEQEFVRDALPVSLIGMNADLMCQYIEFVADRLLILLEQPRLYEATNPFEWMHTISLRGKTNFFEKRVSEYAKSRVGVPPQDHIFDTNAQF
jgi:ribonucleoside-diphosphate reductase subunit M2